MVALCLWLAAVGAWGRTNFRGLPFYFEQVGNLQGLAQVGIQELYQDSFGFLWIATQEGLQRFDGYELTPYKHEPFDAHSLSGNNVTHLAEDHQGDLWVIASGMLNRYARREDRFYHYPLAASSGDAVEVVTLLADGPKSKEHREVWVGTRSQGVFRWDETADSFTPYQNLPGEPNSLSSNLVTHLHRDRGGRLWIATYGGGLNKFDPVTGGFTRFFDDPTFDVLSVVGYHKIPNTGGQPPIHEDRNGFLFIITHGGGLLRFNTENETFIQYRHIPDEPRSLSNNLVYGIFPDGGGGLWLATAAGGLDRFDPRSGGFTHYRHDPYNPYSLPPGELKDAVFISDRQGQTWVGTARQGLLHYDADRDYFRKLPLRADGNPTNHITTLLVDRAEALWVGTKNNGLHKYSRYLQKFRGHWHNPNLFDSLPNDAVTAIESRNEHELWIGTSQSGLIRFDRRLGTVMERYEEREQGLPSNRIQTLLRQDDGALWIGTRRGLALLDPWEGTFKQYFENAGLSSEDVRSLFRDRAGRLWVGTRGPNLHLLDEEIDRFDMFHLGEGGFSTVERGALVAITEDQFSHLWIANLGSGLVRFNPEDERQRGFQHDPGQSDSLSHNDVSDVHVDTLGNLWVATRGGGLNRYHYETATFEHFTVKDGLAGNILYAVAEDADGQLWLCSNRGLSSFDPRRNSAKNYDVGDGLRANSILAHGFHYDTANTLYFGTTSGFNYFNPKHLNTNPHAPPLVITDLQVMGQSVDAAHLQQTWELDYHQNYLRFQFSALDFTYPAKNQYFYRLEGLEKNWVPAEKNREANYSNLGPGHYLFRVIGSNNDGVWNEAGTAVSITIRAPWWQSWWFHGLLIVIAASMIYSAFIWQKQRLEGKQQEALLELDLKRKTEELDYARKIQLSMLPGGNLDTPRLTAVGAMRTATEVGGDYYDFQRLPDNRHCIAVGDATGHGFAAGLVVGMTKLGATVWAQTPQTHNLKEAMLELNIGLKRSLTEKTMGMSLGLILLDEESGRTEAAFAGMPFPYHFCAKSGTLKPLVMKGPPLGFLEKIPVQTLDLALEPGDYLISYSDGFPERFDRHNSLWGQDRLEETLDRICKRGGHPESVASQFFAACDAFADGRTHDDDMTVVIVQMKQKR
ncbi:two-component regulator propeller domain-containing protein [Acanthopleuribacter pedis]|uniref:SpoIIE family protein phosphatase n=1 Tax=Acanthopleuribacter pedis TaxID=442870 RepID=A0A8J7QD43_9BACT|nr:two-component regulator propeller domain-containing protein [Acanthopleuribacter pedis]MBO1321225.1 SpoIIE family protein phosphatase [Acanthopleuribacter pedis]